MAETMTAVVFDAPFAVSVQKLEIPRVQHPRDAIIKVEATALCGSELHVFRGLERPDPGFIMGHEFTGIVTEVGDDVKEIKIGDTIVSPFTTSCGNCFYCNNGYSSRCVESLLFGSPKLNGGQAEYVRVPNADGTLFKAPTELDERTVILMADIFPTGFFGAKNAFKHFSQAETNTAAVVIIGCGPVGLCALIAALEYRPKHIFALDTEQSRLDLAKKLGVETLNVSNDIHDVKDRIAEVTEGRGADAVIEVVGLKPALRTAYDLVRPFGVISSIGVHNDDLPFSSEEGYAKNVRLQMGRCPVRSIFPEALALLTKKQHLMGFMFDKVMPLTDAVEGYRLFNEKKVGKVMFSMPK